MAGSVSYYYEPDKALVDRHPEYCYRYVPENQQDDLLTREIDRMFRGQIRADYQIAEKGLADLLRTPFCDSILLKWVWLTGALGWLAERYPDVTVVQICRHPIPQFLSWKSRGWTPEDDLQRLLEQPLLLEGPLAPYAPLLREAETYWQKAAAFWGSIAHLQLEAHRPEWVLREHEWFCLQPEERIRWLIEKLGLSWSDAISEFLSPERQQQVGPGYGEARDPRDEVHKWVGKVTARELREFETIFREFQLPFYPEMNPEASWLDEA